MRIEKYGISLERVTSDTVELLRQWRNDHEVSQYMEFRDYITPEMQKKWFENLDDECDYYFIIEFDGSKIGMINIKNIMMDRKTGEFGIFIYDKALRTSDLAFRAMCALLDFYFEDLQLETAEAHILRDNKVAQRYNACFGYVLQPDQNEVLNQLYVLKKSAYMANRANIVWTFLD